MPLLDTLRAQREISLVQAGIFAAQAVICTIASVTIYRWAGASGGLWAAVSAILVLQPGVRQSLAASVVRVLANLLGAGTGVLVSLAYPHGLTAVCLALALVIILCELLRLDLGLRSACASLLIVTLSPDPEVLHRGVERAVAVSVGCAIALLLQLALVWMRRQVEYRKFEEGE
jgi:uncharacterized membrane protein YgaE (UPF0421/DUF939 family)